MCRTLKYELSNLSLSSGAEVCDGVQALEVMRGSALGERRAEVAIIVYMVCAETEAAVQAPSKPERSR